MDILTPIAAASILRRAMAGDDTIPATQLSEAAAQCVKCLKEGTISLFGVDGSSLLNYDGPEVCGHPTGTLAALKMLAQLHPLLAGFCRECEEAAAACNAAPIRLGFYFCTLDDESYTWQANWIRSDLRIYEDLFVDLEFLFLSPTAEYSVAFGSYCNHGCSSPKGMKTPFFVEHSWLDLSSFAPHNLGDNAMEQSQKQAARAFAGRRPFPCPFCGYQFVKSGLFGRKCPGCKKVLPKN